MAQADVIFVNGSLFTEGLLSPVVASVAVRYGVIVHVGGGWSMEHFAGGTPTAPMLDSVRPPIGDDLAYRGLLRGQQELLAMGVTGWQDACVGTAFGMPDTLEVYLKACEPGDLLGQASAVLWWEHDEGLQQLPVLQERRQRVAELVPGGQLIARTVKIMVDGVAENFTAAMSAPYLDSHGHSPDNRHHVAHLQVVNAAEIHRFIELDASANLQMLWACLDPQLVELTSYTAGSAYITHRDKTTGRIEIGYRADLVVLDRDPFVHPLEEIYKTSVISTWIAGRCVYSSKETKETIR